MRFVPPDPPVSAAGRHSGFLVLGRLVVDGLVVDRTSAGGCCCDPVRLGGVAVAEAAVSAVWVVEFVGWLVVGFRLCGGMVHVGVPVLRVVVVPAGPRWDSGSGVGAPLGRLWPVAICRYLLLQFW